MPITPKHFRMDARRKAWHIQPGESEKAYGWFCRYRDMDPRKRSLEALAKVEAETEDGYTDLTEDQQKKRVYSVNKMLAKFSGAYNWVERIRAHDGEKGNRVADENIEAHAKAAREATEHHLNMFKGLRKVAYEKLKYLVDNPEACKKISYLELLATIRGVFGMERLALGIDDVEGRATRSAGSADPEDGFTFEDAKKAAREALAEATKKRLEEAAEDKKGGDSVHD